MKKKKILKRTILLFSIALFTVAVFYPTEAKAFEPSVDGFYYYYHSYHCVLPVFTTLGYSDFAGALDFATIIKAYSFSWHGLTSEWCAVLYPDHTLRDIEPKYW